MIIDKNNSLQTGNAPSLRNINPAILWNPQPKNGVIMQAAILFCDP